MSFNSPLFFYFIFLFIPLYFILVDRPEARMIALILGGLIFYFLGPRADLLIFLFCILSNFLLTQGMSKWPRMGGAILFGAIALPLSILAYFRILQESSGLFPLGLSFFVFTGMAYSIDVYNNKVRPLKFLEYLAAISFFPTLISGPLMRVQDIARQVKEKFADFRTPRGAVALVLISNGFFKKGIAETLPMISNGHPSLSLHSPTQASWLAVICFAGRYYADFSGYTDIARGVAHLLGFEVPENFHLPYFSRSINEFWRRWHMSLNLWVREYLFQPMIYSQFFSFLRNIPLLGPRLFKKRYYVSMILSMCVIGVWHGFTWNYLLWGFYMGVLLCLNLEELWPDQNLRSSLPQRLLTFFFVLNGYVIFMHKTLGRSVSMFSSMYDFSGFNLNFYGWPYFLAAILFLALPHALDFCLIKKRYLVDQIGLAWLSSCVLLLMYSLLTGFSGVGFVYFNF